MSENTCSYLGIGRMRACSCSSASGDGRAVVDAGTENAPFSSSYLAFACGRLFLGWADLI